MGTIKATNIEPIADNGTVTLGSSGDTLTVPSGVTVAGAMANTPAFEARLHPNNQSLNHNTSTKVQCSDEIFDSNNCYDTSNYRFTPTVAGKYYCYFGLRGFAGGSEPDGVRFMLIQPSKNGSVVRDYNSDDTDPNELRTPFFSISTVIELNGSTDYLEFFAKVYAQNLSNSGVEIITNASYFGAYRLIGT